MKAKELRELTPEELKQKLSSLKEELFNLRKTIYTAKLEKPHRIWQLRKDIARILTIFKEWEKKNVPEEKKNSDRKSN
ncbi:MAG: 50S ribosomal protein L29 [Candidatus Omnitrophica bacterium]|nr:50S ribosomal protein L29 [Candidatus Omnitrophota bacterium]